MRQDPGGGDEPGLRAMDVGPGEAETAGQGHIGADKQSQGHRYGGAGQTEDWTGENGASDSGAENGRCLGQWKNHVEEWGD